MDVSNVIIVYSQKQEKNSQKQLESYFGNTLNVFVFEIFLFYLNVFKTAYILPY